MSDQVFNAVVLVGLGGAALGVYLLANLIWPYAPCKKCTAGKIWSPTGKRFRLCPRCGGNGRRVRWLRKHWRAVK